MGNYKKTEQEIILHKLCREARESYLEEESRLPDFAEYLAKYLYNNGVVVKKERKRAQK